MLTTLSGTTDFGKAAVQGKSKRSGRLFTLVSSTAGFGIGCLNENCIYDEDSSPKSSCSGKLEKRPPSRIE